MTAVPTVIAGLSTGGAGVSRGVKTENVVSLVSRGVFSDFGLGPWMALDGGRGGRSPRPREIHRSESKESLMRVVSVCYFNSVPSLLSPHEQIASKPESTRESSAALSRN